MQPYLYPLSLTPDAEGRLLVTFLDFPFAATDGRDRQEALREAQDCLDTAAAAMIREGGSLPEPSKAKAGQLLLAPDPVLIAKAALRDAMAREGIGTSELARRIGIQETAARRLCDPFHRSKIDKLSHALDALGLRIVASIQPKAA